METKQYTTVDKSSWPAGEWQDEPDKMQWPDPDTGLPCLIVRGPSGALCGYVGVSDQHPWHGREYSDDVVSADVHGGLTFSRACAHTTDESKHICHVPGPGEPDNVWWFGFDCAHSGDLCPEHERRYGMPMGYETYKSFNYVKREVTKLARQLADAQS